MKKILTYEISMPAWLWVICAAIGDWLGDFVSGFITGFFGG